jgi:putative flippase GtrA
MGEASAWKADAKRHARGLSRYAGVGVLNTITDFSVYLALEALGLAPLLANLGAFSCGVTQSYLLNARFTFGERGKPAATSVQGFFKFVATNLASLAISTAFIALLAGALGAFGAKIAAAVVTLFWNYATSAAYIFRRRKKSVGEAA